MMGTDEEKQDTERKLNRLDGENCQEEKSGRDGGALRRLWNCR